MATAGRAGSKGQGEGSKRRVNSALDKPVKPDEKLAAVIGPEECSRPEVVKKIWDYIKSEKLQDPANKRMINADEKLMPVFDGKKQVSMFEMTKLVSKHLD